MELLFLLSATDCLSGSSGRRPQNCIIFERIGYGKLFFFTQDTACMLICQLFQEKELKGTDLKITFTPTQHWCVRSGFDKNEVLWGSFAICTKNIKTWFGGDTGYCKCNVEEAVCS